MRPSRGRPPASGRAKPCFVRLEKVASRDDKDDEDENNKKLTGPIKKRPVVIKKSPVGRPKKIEIEEDLSSYNLVTARTRRTPKPNPKYSNDHIVSTGFRSRGRGGDSMDEDSDEMGDEFGFSSDAEQPSEEEDDDDDSSMDEKMRRKGVVRRKLSPQPVKRGPGRPPRMRFSPIQRKSTPDPDRSKAFEHMRKRKTEWEKQGDDETSLIARNKRLNIELYDASDSDVPAVSPASRRGRPPKSVASSSKVLEAEKRPQSRSELARKYNSNQRAMRNDSDNESLKRHSEDEDDIEMTTGAASTIDDFETMPTFTIVNINDIINKKGDVLISKSSQEEDSSNASSQASRNRRKSMHTTILSDKIDQSKLTPPPRSPFPPRKPTTSANTLNNNLSKTISTSSSSDNFKSAPRILNSVLAKKTKPVTPLVSKLATNRDTDGSNYDSGTGKQSKENVHVNTYGGASSTSRKLPNEKVLVQRQGNKLIKKITCFETWYVINIPPYEAPAPKNNFEMSITELGNLSGEIALPSDLWNYKITLQKMPESQLAKGNYEEFTGDVQDLNIPESEKHKYQPINVMFRRNNQNPRLRMPYDRAVIFKNKTYFVNIDGKNVRLIGAPQTISSISEIETLLEIVDEMGLGNQFVEQTTFIL